ncbi:D-lactaldehyde dehydrogenase [Fomes fomentarius]|nr:D-lactaldehyde dehydrogenase [Fomes fomentarius]
MLSFTKVLVTGGDGLSVAWTLKAFLHAGFYVRRVVHDPTEAIHLRKSLLEYGSRLEFVIVAQPQDLQPVLNTAAVGVQVSVHIASSGDPKRPVDPGVEGMLSILRTASASASVKRVVLLSSCVEHMYDETCWSDTGVVGMATEGQAVEETSYHHGRQNPVERQAWSFYEQQREKTEMEGKEYVGCDLTVINRPYVFGPVIHRLGGWPRKLDRSNQLWYNAVVWRNFSPNDSWIDVRDLAYTVVLAVKTTAASGKSFVVSGGAFRWQDFIITAHRVSPNRIPPLEGYDADAPHMVQHNVMEAKEVLGVTYRSMEETVRDILSDYEARTSCLG